MYFQPNEEIKHIKCMYTYGIVLSLGLLPASIAWNSAVFTYVKKVLRADRPNPYLRFCEQQGIEPMQFVEQVVNSAREAKARGEFNPWSIRIKLYLSLLIISVILWNFFR
jgi:hypothetical protein